MFFVIGHQSIHGLLDNAPQLESEIMTKFGNFVLEIKSNASHKMNRSCKPLWVSPKVLFKKIPQAIFNDVFDDEMPPVHGQEYCKTCEVAVGKRLLVNLLEDFVFIGLEMALE